MLEPIFLQEFADAGLFRDFMLLIIAVLLGIIGWGLRKWYHELKETLDELMDQLNANSQQIERHQTMLFGKENTPWNGYNNEIAENRGAISENRDVLNGHETRLDRHGAALSREEMIDRAREPEQPSVDDLDDLHPLKPHMEED